MDIKKTINSVLVILTFLLAFYGRRLLSLVHPIEFNNSIFDILAIYSFWLIPSLVVIWFFYGCRRVLVTVGLNNGFLFGLIFSLGAVSPMLISSAFEGSINDNLDILNLLKNTLFAGFMEEFLFRGFLFGLLFYYLGWGFIPASLVGAFVFGIGHLYQGESLAETIGVFSVTAIGAVWFSWLYVEWNKNLWIPVFLHVFMNLSWILFDVSSNALGGMYSNLFRAITIALTIIITIKYSKKHGLNVNKRNLFVNRYS